MKKPSIKNIASVIALIWIATSSPSFGQRLAWEYTISAPQGSTIEFGDDPEFGGYPFGLFLGANGVCAFPVRIATVQNGGQSQSSFYRIVWLSTTGRLIGNVDLPPYSEGQGNATRFRSVLSAMPTSLVLIAGEGLDESEVQSVRAYQRAGNGNITLVKTTPLGNAYNRGYSTFGDNMATRAFLTWEYKNSETKRELVLKRYSL